MDNLYDIDFILTMTAKWLDVEKDTLTYKPIQKIHGFDNATPVHVDGRSARTIYFAKIEFNAEVYPSSGETNPVTATAKLATYDGNNSDSYTVNVETHYPAVDEDHIFGSIPYMLFNFYDLTNSNSAGSYSEAVVIGLEIHY